MEKYIDGTSMKRTFVCFLVMAIVFHLDKFLLGPYAPIAIINSFDSEFPRYASLANWLKEYGFVGWYPHIAGGAPSHAYHSGPGYILALLSLLFPIWTVNGVLIVLMMTVSGYGVYRLLRDFFSITHPLSLLGGFLFACSNQGRHFNIHLLYNYAFPLVFVLLHRSPRLETPLPSLAFRVFFLIILSWISYPVLTTGYPLMHLGLILVLASFDWKNLKPWLIQFFMYWVGYALLYTPIVYSLIEYIPFAQRTYPEKVTLDAMLSTEALQWILGHIWNSLIYSYSVGALVFPIVVGGMPLMFVSPEVRRMGIFLFSFVLVSAILGTKIATLFPGNWIEKMDFLHISLPLPLILTIFSVVALEKIGKQTRGMKIVVFSIGLLTLGLDISHALSVELQFQMISVFTPGNNWMAFLRSVLLFFTFFSFIFCFTKMQKKY